MAVLTDKDLFDFDGYARRLAELGGVTQEWAQSTVASVSRIREAFDAARSEIAPLRESLKSVRITGDGSDRQVVDYIQKMSEVGSRVNAARQTIAALTEAQQLNAQVVVDLTARFTTLQQKFSSLDSTSKDYQKQQRAIASEMKTVSRAIDAQSKSLQVSKTVIDTAEGSLNHLRKQTTELKRALDAMPNAYDQATGKINEQNRAAVALNAQYQKSITLLKQIESGQQVHGRNVGNYPKSDSGQSSASSMAVGATSRLVGAGLAIAGIDSTLSAIQKVGEITLQFDSLDSALKVVSNDTALFTQRQAMLQKVSDDLGQDLSIVEKNYTNLTASSKGTRLEGEKTDKIFESIVGTMGRLKRPTEDVDGALLAIGQIMSKGTVQSEELRGQLGERLPGAFNIAARAMGVTTAKLSDMLKSGEVVASEFLPKFADELEKTFNPNHERRVEGLAANLARLRNETVEWVKGLDIGNAAGQWIGNITAMARSVREFFGPAFLESTRQLADQTATVNQLEAALPGLLSRYDELQKKSQLTATEQKELQTIVGQVVNLVPSAATGFDNYGNALDINKGKVAAFTLAQRELNAELNKQAIADLKNDAYKSIGRISSNQLKIQRGKETQQLVGPGGSILIDSPVDGNRAKALNDANLKESQNAISKAKQILALGGEVDGKLRDYIKFTGDLGIKQLLIVDGYNKKIAEKQAEATVLFDKTDKASQQKREASLKELKTLQDKRAAILNPSVTPTNTGSDKPEVSEAAQNKARIAAEKRLRDGLGIAKATQDKNLANLSNDRQDGLIDEQTAIEKQLQITLNGINQRQILLERANKKESKEYQQLLDEKAEADTKYKRSQLQLDLKSAKSQTGEALAKLDPSTFENGDNDLAYIEKRHQITEAGLKREQVILKESNQEGSQLFKDNHQAILDEQADYLRRRAKAEEVAYKKELADTKDALKEINQAIAADLEKRLQDLDKFYQQEEQKIAIAVKKGQLSPVEGDVKINALRIAHLKEEAQAFEQSYQKDRDLSNSLIDDKIAKLTDYKDYAMLTAEEIADKEKEIAELKKLRNQQEVDDNKSKNAQLAQNEEKAGNQRTDTELKNLEKIKAKRAALLQLSLDLAGTLGEATFSILSSNNERESQQLDQQHENELKLAGDNADAKARIEDQYQKRKAELARKAAITEREQALFSIALNTAMGVASVLSTGGGTHYLDLGISAGVLTAFVIAAGIAQSAAVLAKPLPAYKHGKLATDTYTGRALAGEAGTELFVDREGYSQLLTKPTVIDTKAGDRIYTASQTSALLADMKNSARVEHVLESIAEANWIADRLQQGRIHERIMIHSLALQANPGLTEAQLKRAFGDALDSRPQDVTIYDQEGVKRGRRQANSYQEYMEQRTKW